MTQPGRSALALGLISILAVSVGVRSERLRSPEPRVVTFELNNNHVVMPVEWQGQRLSFLLDTGAGASFLDFGRARAAKLAVVNQFAATGAGPGSSAAGALQRPITVTIPGEPDAVTAQVGAVLDLADIAAHAGRDIDGIMGADFIRRFVLEIDYEHQRLRLHDPATFTYAGPGTVVPMTFKNLFPTVQASLRLPDQSVIAVAGMLDVGSSLAVGITQPVSERNRLAERLQATEPMSVGRGAGGATQSRIARLPELAIGAVRLANPVATLAQAGSGVMSSGTLFDVNIGGGVMRRFTMLFDYSRSRVIFEPNAAASEPFEFDMSGLVMTTEGASHERVIVETAQRGSPAALAGFQRGDRLVLFDGQPLEKLTLEAIRLALRIDSRTYRVVVERQGRQVTLTMTTKRLV
jgi:hypothetical protein